MNISEELKQNKRLHYRFARRLRELKQFDGKRLIINNRKDKVYYALVGVGESNGRKEYLGTERDPRVRAMQEKRFLEKALAKLGKCIRQLERVASEYEPFDAEALNASLPQAYRLTQDHLNDVLGKSGAKRWKEEMLKKKEKLDKRHPAPRPEERKHCAKNGVMMRSKSEVIIANLLISLGIEFIYEMPTLINGCWLHPDFTIYCPRTGRVVLWEHNGMMNVQEYQKSFAWRINQYTRARYVPNLDLILTFEDGDGNIDSAAIDRIVTELLLGGAGYAMRS